MENFWNLRVNDRLAQWKDFRRSLDQLPIEQAIEQVNQFWSRAPGVGYYLAPDDISNWPDPWTLIYENYYCDVAKVLGIVYTIALTSHKNNLDVEIRVYKDPATRHEYNLAWISQGKYIVNLINNEVVNKEQFDKKFILIKQYKAEDLDLVKYNN